MPRKMEGSPSGSAPRLNQTSHRTSRTSRESRASAAWATPLGVARRQLEAAVPADPELADAHMLLAEMLMANGEPRAALPHLRKAAASADATVRERAAGMLRRMGSGR